jgi:transcriptional regulator with XRE-family HTH domain
MTRLRLFRLALGLSQLEAARLFGVSHVQYSKAEGRGVAGPTDLKRLGFAFSVHDPERFLEQASPEDRSRAAEIHAQTVRAVLELFQVPEGTEVIQDVLRTVPERFAPKSPTFRQVFGESLP